MSRYPAILQAAIDAGCTNPPGQSRWHGEHHWKCVAEVGLYLADQAERSEAYPFAPLDRDFITTFALLHDVERLNDGGDQRHGIRAEKLFCFLLYANRLAPAWVGTDGMPRNAAMMYALRHHCDPKADLSFWAHDPIAEIHIGICWDADRLCRYRLHETPSNAYLNTSAAKVSRGSSIRLKSLRTAP